MAAGRISMQATIVENDVIGKRCAHGREDVRPQEGLAKVGLLLEHSVLKSDWFLLVILTCRKELVIGMFIKEYRHSFRTLYFVTQIAVVLPCHYGVKFIQDGGIIYARR